MPLGNRVKPTHSGMFKMILRTSPKCLNTMNQATIDSIASRIGLANPSWSKQEADFPKHVAVMVSSPRQRNPRLMSEDVLRSWCLDRWSQNFSICFKDEYIWDFCLSSLDSHFPESTTARCGQSSWRRMYARYLFCACCPRT